MDNSLPTSGTSMNLFWADIVETMTEGLVLIDPEGRIHQVNRALAEMTGYPVEDLTGRSCTVFTCDACESVRGQGQGDWCRLLKEEHSGVDRRRCHIRHRSGGWVSVLKNATVLRDNQGHVRGVVEVFTDITELEDKDRKIDELTRRLHEDGQDFEGMVGHSDLMGQLFEIMEKAARSGGPIVIYGESGTGKELAAAAIHNLGPVREGPFVQMNCGALSESLLESELFGHVKGAFTGAYRHRRGRFEAAHGGDIFLDEIGDMSPSLQVRLLRVLETKTIERVGDHEPIAADARVIAATNKDLADLVRSGRFRADLYYRLNIFPIYLPPLRDRIEDVPHLVEHFLHRLAEAHPKNLRGVSGRVMRLFLEYSWPGNIRELKSVLEYAWFIADGTTINQEHLPPHFSSARIDSGHKPGGPATAWFGQQEDENRRRSLETALVRCRGNQTRAAGILGVSRVTVWKWIKKYGLKLEDYTSPEVRS